MHRRLQQEPLLGFDHFFPLIVRQAGMRLVTILIPKWTPPVLEWLKRRKDLRKGQLIRRSSEAKSAALTRRRTQNAHPCEVPQDLGEVLRRYAGAFGDARAGDGPILYVLS
jgi:hypothetical protein